MDSSDNLTVIENLNDISSLDDFELKLEENYYEKLFIEEMNFRNNPNKTIMKSIIQKHCQAVEYFSSIGDNKRAMNYKLLNNIFLNDPQVIETLDEEDNIDNNIDNNDIKCDKNKLIKNILILNQKKNSDKFKDSNDNSYLSNKFNIVLCNEK